MYIMSLIGSEGEVQLRAVSLQFTCLSVFPEAHQQLRYDPDRVWCNWSDLVDCGNRPICDEYDMNCQGYDPEDDTTPSSEDDTTPRPEDDTTPIPIDCTRFGSCKEGEFIAKAPCNPDYCMCAGGIYNEMPCPEGLVFNPQLDVCDWPDNVEGCP